MFSMKSLSLALTAAVVDAKDSSSDALILYQRHSALVKNAALSKESSTRGKVDWSICNSEVYSNLGGVGGKNPPGTDMSQKEIRFKRVSDLGGTALDLRITNTTHYHPNPANPKKAAEEGDTKIGGEWYNGRQNCMGMFNMYSPGAVTLKFQMVLSGTNTLAPNDYTYDFTVFDFDASKKGMEEHVIVSGIDSWVEGRVSPTVQGDSYVFKPVSVEVENPNDPMDMTQEQMDASVGLVYSRNEWEIEFQAVDTKNSGATGGRNFLFAARSLLHDKGTPQTTTTTTCLRDDAGVCVVYDDPHIDGFDNPRQGPWVSMFDSHRPVSLMRTGVGSGSWSAVRQPNIDVNVYELGDFWLVKNKKVHIQGRYNVSAEFGGGRSGLAALAVSGPVLGGGALLVEPKFGAITCFGERIGKDQRFTRKTAAGPVHVRTYFNAYTEGGVAPGGVDIELPSDIFVQIRRYNTHLDAKITMPRSAGKTDGQCGNFNGDPFDDTLEEVGKRMKSTSVAKEELLFTKPFFE